MTKDIWRQYKHNINLNSLLVERKPTSYLKVEASDWPLGRPMRNLSSRAGALQRSGVRERAGRSLYPAHLTSVPLHTLHRIDVSEQSCRSFH